MPEFRDRPAVIGRFGDISLRLAEDFGFCYGVDRAVDYAYQATYKFPDHRIFLVGEIIHNPHVNTRLRESGVTFLYPDAETGEGSTEAVETDVSAEAVDTRADAPAAAAVQQPPHNFWWLVGGIVLAGVILALLL